ncbi:hypothetical protein KC334_g45 [Hortaea werneckii]|nr:hypothetical protein KC334_g45 [Hortaea werneckii]
MSCKLTQHQSRPVKAIFMALMLFENSAQSPVKTAHHPMRTATFAGTLKLLPAGAGIVDVHLSASLHSGLHFLPVTHDRTKYCQKAKRLRRLLQTLGDAAKERHLLLHLDQHRQRIFEDTPHGTATESHGDVLAVSRRTVEWQLLGMDADGADLAPGSCQVEAQLESIGVADDLHDDVRTTTFAPSFAACSNLSGTESMA